MSKRRAEWQKTNLSDDTRILLYCVTKKNHTYEQWKVEVEKLQGLFKERGCPSSRYYYDQTNAELDVIPETAIQELPEGLQEWVRQRKLASKKLRASSHTDELTRLKSKMATLRQLNEEDALSPTFTIEWDSAERKYKAVAPALNVHTFGETRQEAYDKMGELIDYYFDDLLSDSPEDE